MSPIAEDNQVAQSRFCRWYLVPALLLLVFLLAAACTPSHPQSTFDAAGPVARSQLNLFYIIFWAAVFVFVVVEGILVYAVIRFRRKPNQEIPAQTHGNTPLEIAWTIAPAIVLAIVAVPTIFTIFDNARTPSEDENPIHVTVTAHQWWWEFEYFTKEELDREEADLDRVKEGELDISDAYTPTPYLVTANELHIPVGVPVNALLESSDVIHSFWIPKLAGKVDIVPNNRNTMWFQADEPGTFLGQCAEFCGISHANMRLQVIAEPTQQAFDSWVVRQQAPPAVPAEPLFGRKACGVCHTTSGPEPEGVQKTRMDAFLRGLDVFPAPNLTHFASRETFAGGILERTDDNLTRWLRDPGDPKPGNHMAELAGVYQNPRLALNDQDIEALVAYLQSLT